MSSSSDTSSSNEPASEPPPALRLTAGDFDAYLAEPAPGEALTEARLSLRQRMVLWGCAVVARLRELDVTMEISASDAVQTGFQRVYFWRDAPARAELDHLLGPGPGQANATAPAVPSQSSDPARPHERHVVLGLKLDAASLEVSIELDPEAWVDLRNVWARLANAERALELTGALEALPEEFSLGLAGDEERLQARSASSDVLRTLLARAEAERGALWLGWTIPRDVALSHAELLDDQLADALVALGHVYRLVAWAPDNDLLEREIDAVREEEARNEQTERVEAEREARRDEERRPRPRPSESWLEDAKNARGGSESDLWSGADSQDAAPRDSGRSAARGAVVLPAAALRPTRRAFPKLARAIVRRAPLVTEVDPTAPIEKGTRVRVLAGPFADKVGVVQELDGKGNGRIMLGLLAMWLPTSDLIASAEGRERPSLGSSHRKPTPMR